MYCETFPTLVNSIKLSIRINAGRVSVSAYSARSLDTIAYDSGFEFGHARFTGNKHYITTGGGHFIVSGKTCERIVAWLKENGVKVNDYNIKGKKATHVIVDEIYPVTTSASEAVAAAAAAAADSTDD